MSKQYCFKLDLPDNRIVDQVDLKAFVKNLYKSVDDNSAIQVIYVPTDSSVCTLLTKKTKSLLEQVENVHARLRPKDLLWKGVQLSRPSEFVVEPVKWWNSQDMGVRWSSLSHKGPYFTHLIEPYTPIGARLKYAGKYYDLTPKEEQLAVFYAKRLISEQAGNVVDLWTKDDVFRDNFWKDYKTYLTPEHQDVFKDFSKISWNDVIDKINTNKTIQTPEKKAQLEEKKREYGYAMVDGNKEKIGNFVVEPSAIFYGRGDNPNRGRIKREINPEDVVINIGVTDPTPSPPAGHSWKNVIHDQTAVWLAKWNDSITGDIKYMMLSMEGKFKGQGDLNKYEKARKLQKDIDKIRRKYTKDAGSSNLVNKQLGTVLYLIDNLGIRVGNEKKEDETDTIGATTLRVENIQLKGGNTIIFDFLGKDSIQFYKEIKVSPKIYANFEQLMKNKKKSDQVFDKISAKNINDYLKKFNKDFSAKVFRTRLASEIMYNALKDIHIPKGSTKQAIKLLFNKANAIVAEVLNHTRNISKKAQESIKALEDDLRELKKERKKDPENQKIKKKIETIQAKIEAKKDIMSVAINTSLSNYIDPRIIIAWTKKEGIDPSNVYSATLLKKFTWANEMTRSNWNWLTTPIMKKVHKEREEGPGTLEDYQILSDFCSGNIDIDGLNDVSKEALNWVYSFCQYAVDQGKATQKCQEIIAFYDAPF